MWSGHEKMDKSPSMSQLFGKGSHELTGCRKEMPAQGATKLATQSEPSTTDANAILGTPKQPPW